MTKKFKLMIISLFFFFVFLSFNFVMSDEVIVNHPKIVSNFASFPIEINIPSQYVGVFRFLSIYESDCERVLFFSNESELIKNSARDIDILNLSRIDLIGVLNYRDRTYEKDDGFVGDCTIRFSFRGNRPNERVTIDSRLRIEPAVVKLDFPEFEWDFNPNFDILNDFRGSFSLTHRNRDVSCSFIY